ncbi:MAG: amidohydrolase family protein [Microbacterium sp.]|uniref:amidohydrolase family protein n=1 Tax=Microbacterium sp. TaxID=51671 RepID=UPI0039E6A94B
MHDLVVENAVIVTVDAARSVVRGWLAVDDGVVAALGCGTAPAARDRIDAGGGILHPGFVSAHQHTMDTLGRAGHGEVQEFFDWLLGTYYGTVLGCRPADAARAAGLAARDLARAGITTVLDCWGVGEAGSERARGCLAATAEVAASSGLRWILAPMVSDRLPPEWTPMLDEAGFAPEALIAPTSTALAFAADALTLGRGRLEVWTSAELPEMASDRLLAGLAALTADAGSGFTTHLCASGPGAVDAAGERAVARLGRLGLLRPGSVGAHLTHTDAADRRMLAASGAGAVHCATATMLGGGGRSPLGELVAAGVPVGLGLDNATLNATADMGAEMRHVLMFDRACGTSSRRATAADALAHATIHGARALGMADRIGSLEPGKRADLVLVDTAGSHFDPRRDPATALVLQARVDDIRLVLVDGAPVYAR